MSSRAITERKDAKGRIKRWKAPVETAPSVMGEELPLWPRIMGGLGVTLVLFGAVAWIVLNYKHGVLVLPMFHWELGPVSAGVMGVLGLALMLYHAARDAEMQIRRAYMAFGYVWLAAGIAVSVLPLQGPAGSHFLTRGVPCLAIAPLFLLAYIRNETEEIYREVAIYVLGAAGAGAALGGFLFGSIYENFLLPDAVVLLLLALIFYLWPFLGLAGEKYELSYRTGLGLTIGGLAFFLIALVRSAVLPWMASKGWINLSSGPNYLMPSGLLLMGLGLLYGFSGLASISDTRLIVMTRRELATYFQTPVAYIVLFGFMCIACWVFSQFVKSALLERSPQLEGGISTRPMPEPVVIYYFIGWFPMLCLLFVVPVLTMRLLSEERRTGTLEMVLSAPVDEIHVVLSKFLAGLAMFMLVWLPFWLYLLALRVEGGKPFDYRPFVGFLVAQLFSGAAFVSMGLFFSALTRSQITAAILTFAGMVALFAVFFIGQVLELEEPQQRALAYASYVDLWINAFRGKLEARALVFQSSMAVFWLFLTWRVLDARKWL
jgi:ABC-type transport system involved in multi-copper enzyme maturation permease subunit